MKIAVVILNWNGELLLKEFLPSVVKHSEGATVYVADNASGDGSKEFLQQNFPEVKIIQNKTNGGFAKGYNDALVHVKEDIFVLLNNDVEVTPNWLAGIISEFHKNPDTAALQPKILNYRNKEFFEYAGAAGGFIDKLGYPYCRGRLFDTLEKDLGQYDDTATVFWASGACMAIRKDVFFKAGKFDEDFFAHQEEIDLCWRIFNMGLKVKAVGNSTVYHLGGGTLHSMRPRKTFYNFRNSLYALLKNAPGKQVGLLIFLRLILDALAAVKFLFNLKPAHSAAILQAHFNFYSHLKPLLKKRKNLQKKEKYFHKSSVVMAYYLRGTKRFNEL